MDPLREYLMFAGNYKLIWDCWISLYYKLPVEIDMRFIKWFGFSKQNLIKFLIFLGKNSIEYETICYDEEVSFIMVSAENFIKIILNCNTSRSRAVKQKFTEIVQLYNQYKNLKINNIC